MSLPDFCEKYPELWAYWDDYGILEDGGYTITYTDEEQVLANVSKWRRIAKRPRLIPIRIK